MAHEFDGSKYAAASRHQKEWGARLVEELGLAGDEHVLDLGCGDGAVTGLIAQAVPNGLVVGVDASEGMLCEARKRSSNNVRFELMDISNLNLSDRFDVIFSNATLHWVRNHARLLRNVHRHLKPGGVARFNFAGEGNCTNLNGVLRDVTGAREFSSYFADFEWPWYMPGVGEYEALLDASPFEEWRVWSEIADRAFPNTDVMIGWIDQPSLVPFLPHITPPDRSRFRDQVVARMTERCRRQDGTCFETFRRINLLAVR